MSYKVTKPKLREHNRWKGRRIGLLGGSFNPTHQGHVHIAKIAKAQFDLDFVWWIVTPQNPLKDKNNIAPYNNRFSQVEAITCHSPYQIPTHLENALGTQYTYETVMELQKYFPKTDFLWICGMDNAHIFHRWDKWRDLASKISVAFIARPPAQRLTKNAPIKLWKKTRHFYGTAKTKNLKKPSIYWIKSVKMLDISSTEIRKKSKK